MSHSPSVSRVTKIQGIIQSRQPHANLANKEVALLDRLYDQLQALKALIVGRGGQVSDASSGKLSSDMLSEIEALSVDTGVARQRFQLLAARFNRRTLNFGIVGRARQGKSTLIQQITGLTDSEIPTGSKGHCTGAPSVIENNDVAEASAEVTFHTESAFFENIILPFFTRLRDADSVFASPPSSLAEFSRFQLQKELPEDLSRGASGRALNSEHLRKLREFQQNLDVYRSNLSGGIIHQVSREKIRSYIAQQDSQENQQHVWRAVQMVHVKCKFPNADVGQIALVDTPGLGDFMSGAEDRLVETVGRNLDIVIFLRMPPPNGGYCPEDVDLYDLLARANRDISPVDWSYFVLNEDEHARGRNPYFVEALREGNIKVRKILHINCRNSREVEVGLGEILDDVSVNLQRLDERLLDAARKRTEELWEMLRSFISRMLVLLPKAAPAPAGMLKELFSPVFDSISNKLAGILASHRANRYEPDRDYLGAIKEAMSRLELVPQGVLKNEFGYGGIGNYFQSKVHELRVLLSQGLSDIDIPLGNSFSRLRSEILEVFRSESGGCLSFLDGLCERDAWMLFLEKWERSSIRDRHSVISAMRLMISEGLSFKNWIQPRVRECLDPLDLATIDGAVIEAGATIEVVNEILTLAWEKAWYEINQRMRGATGRGDMDFSVEPSMARFALVQDFVDLAMNAGGTSASSNRWELFYDEYRSEIWPTHFRNLEDQTQFIRELNEHFRSLSSIIPTKDL
jgi:hypothetical protein